MKTWLVKNFVDFVFYPIAAGNEAKLEQNSCIPFYSIICEQLLPNHSYCFHHSKVAPEYIICNICDGLCHLRRKLKHLPYSKVLQILISTCYRIMVHSHIRSQWIMYPLLIRRSHKEMMACRRLDYDISVDIYCILQQH